MTPIGQLPTIKSSWMLLGLSALAFELVALYFQYQMDLEPCIMCIYQRIAVLGIMFSGFITAIIPNLMIMRLLGFGLWGVSAIWGLLIAIEHVDKQTETNPFALTACERVPNLPDWFALHEWFPAIFEARGSCGDIDWIFLGMSMPQWMIVVFGLYSLAFAVILGARLFTARTI